LYTLGLRVNAVLQREAEGLLTEAVAGYERERQAARQQGSPPRTAGWVVVTPTEGYAA
jgi:hypothetical protein